MQVIELDESTHQYRVDGAPYPSVTQILKFSGLIQDRFYTEESRQFGTAVHKACEYLDRGILKRSTLHPRVEPRVQAYEKFKKETEFIPNLIEKKIYSETYKFCGTLDREGTCKSTPVIVDLKSGSVQPWTELQLAAYQLGLVGERFTHQMFGLELKDDGGYKATKFVDLNSKNQFLCCVSNFYWAKNHGIQGEK